MYKIIDSHQHFWKLSRGDYDWLTPEFKLLYRDFLPEELESLLHKNQVSGTILVQAAATLDETYYLLDLAERYSFILGVVGWVDMLASNVSNTLAKLAENKYFCGIRPMLQTIPDVEWMLKKELSTCYVALQNLDLTFDALILPHHLPYLMQLAYRYPTLRIVIDHAAKPAIKSNQFKEWAVRMNEIASYPNIYCKLSGLLTETASHQTVDDLVPYLDHLFSCFGAQRIMWGSDYPVLNLASDYCSWLQLCKRYVEPLGEEALAQVFGKVAMRFYRGLCKEPAGV